MSVDVGQMEASMLEERDLRGGFGLDFGRADAATEEATEKRSQLGREEACAGIYKSGNLMRRKDRLSIDEHKVTANA
jgi:hypothetical protein